MIRPLRSFATGLCLTTFALSCGRDAAPAFSEFVDRYLDDFARRHPGGRAALLRGTRVRGTPTARREAERATCDPTYGGCFLGKRGLLKLRPDYAAKMGDGFSLRAFHERVMSNGIAPVRAHRMLMLPGDTTTVIK